MGQAYTAECIHFAAGHRDQPSDSSASGLFLPPAVDARQVRNDVVNLQSKEESTDLSNPAAGFSGSVF
jgi:hypothetical protein